MARATRSIRSSGLPTNLRLVERIGGGSFGEVWLARDTAIGEDVAVKFLSAGSQGSDGERFENEARSLARLVGIPGVVPILHVGLAPDGTPWLVTRHLSGGSLRLVLDTAPPDPFSAPAVELAAVLLKRLAPALAAAHELGVAHGDISPSNVLFDSDSRAWLSDFGMAHLARGDSTGLGSATGTGAAAAGFTPAYAAPERLRGAQPDPRSDIYSLAATIWHVLTGDPRAGVDRSAIPENASGLVGLVRSAMDDIPRRRPKARDLAIAAPQAPGRSRRWRYRRADGQP